MPYFYFSNSVIPVQSISINLVLGDHILLPSTCRRNRDSGRVPYGWGIPQKVWRKQPKRDLLPCTSKDGAGCDSYESGEHSVRFEGNNFSTNCPASLPGFGSGISLRFCFLKVNKIVGNSIEI